MQYKRQNLRQTGCFSHIFQVPRKLFISGLSGLLFALIGLTTLNVSAQGTDVTPPTIVLEEIEDGLAGETQTFTAQVSDDIKLASVVLFHRLAGDPNFLSSEMLPVANSSVYSASVTHSTDDPRNIEYYVQAEDFGGNKALKGFAFDPLVRVMSPDIVAIAATTPTPTAKVSRNRKLLWGALGLIAVGVLASQARSGSSGSSASTTNVPVDIVVNPVNDGFSFSF